MKDFSKFVYAEHAVQEPRAIVSLDGFWIVGLRAQRHIAGYSLQDIMVRHQSLDATIFVDHQGDMLAGLFKGLQQCQDRDRPGYKQRLLYESFQIQWSSRQAHRQQVFRLHYAGDIIKGFRRYWKSGMTTLNDFLANLFDGISKIDPRNLCSWRYE